MENIPSVPGFFYLSPARLASLFVACLEQTRTRYGFRVYGYVVMPEHVHLLVSEPDVELLSTAIQALKIAVSRRARSAGWRQEQPFWWVAHPFAPK